MKIYKIRSQRRAWFSRIDKNGKKCGRDEVFKLVVEQCGQQAAARTATLDRVYLLPDEKRLKKILRRDGTSQLKYRKEGGDCDDFAHILCGRMKEQAMLCDLDSGLAFGTATGALWKDGQMVHHKMNIVVTSDREVYLIEPQNDKWYRPDKRNEYWAIVI